MIDPGIGGGTRRNVRLFRFFRTVQRGDILGSPQKVRRRLLRFPPGLSTTMRAPGGSLTPTGWDAEKVCWRATAVKQALGPQVRARSGILPPGLVVPPPRALSRDGDAGRGNPFGIARPVASVGVRSRAHARREAMMHILTNYLVALGWAVVGAVAMAIALVLLLRVFTWLTP